MSAWGGASWGGARPGYGWGEPTMSYGRVEPHPRDLDAYEYSGPFRFVHPGSRLNRGDGMRGYEFKTRDRVWIDPPSVRDRRSVQFASPLEYVRVIDAPNGQSRPASAPTSAMAPPVDASHPAYAVVEGRGAGRLSSTPVGTLAAIQCQP